MDSGVFRSLVEIQPASGRRPPSPDETTAPLTAPDKVVHRTYPSSALPNGESAIELPAVSRYEQLQSGPTTPRNEVEDLEMSVPGASAPNTASDAVDAAMSVWDPYMNRYRLLALCACSLGNGLNDSAAGALIPYMEKCVIPFPSHASSCKFC